MSKGRTWKEIQDRIAHLSNEEGIGVIDKRRARIEIAVLKWVIGEASAPPIPKPVNKTVAA